MLAFAHAITFDKLLGIAKLATPCLNYGGGGSIKGNVRAF
jgi:hypothetical protein